MPPNPLAKRGASQYIPQAGCIFLSNIIPPMFEHGFTPLLVRSLKSLILRATNVKKQNLTHPKAAKLAKLVLFNLWQEIFGLSGSDLDLLKSYLDG